jgi:hypothetical protein
MYRSDPRSDLRLGDVDRDQAIARLSEHYAAGRLDKEEFDERSDAVWTAKTYADLAPIFADLGPAPSERQRHWDSRGWPGPWGRRGLLPVPFVPVIFVLIALTVLTHIPFVLLAVLGCSFVFARRRRSHHDQMSGSRF